MSQTSSPDPHRLELPRALRLLLWVLVLATAFSFAFVPLRSSQDEWWHLKTGEWIARNGHLPINDIFTYTGENLRWYNHEWLSQLLFYGAHWLGEQIMPGEGIRALITFKSILVTITFGLLVLVARVRGAAWSFALLMAIVAAEISRRTTYPRPPIFSYLLMAGFLLVLYAWKTGRLRSAWLWALVPATALWANLHGMVLLAIVVVGAFAGGEVLELLWRRWKQSGTGILPVTRAATVRTVLLLGVLTLLTTLAAMAQPSGYHLFFLGRNFTADPLLKQIIAEMMPPPFYLPGTKLVFPGMLTFWITAALFPLLVLINRGRLRFGADYLLGAFFLYQALNHWRLLPLFAIAATPIVAGLLTDLTVRRSPAIQRALQYAAGTAVAALFAVYVFIIDENGTFYQRNRQLAHGEAYNFIDYPKPLLDFVIDAKLPGRMLSETNYCGYFMWRLSPEHHKLFTDNRFDLFGSRYHREERIMLFARDAGEPDEMTHEPLAKGWSALLDEYGINLVIIHRTLPLQLALINSGKWRDIFVYSAGPGPGTPLDGWSVWVRDTPENAAAIQRATLSKRSTNRTQPEELDREIQRMVRQRTGAAPVQNPVGSTDWRVPVQR